MTLLPKKPLPSSTESVLVTISGPQSSLGLNQLRNLMVCVRQADHEQRRVIAESSFKFKELLHGLAMRLKVPLLRCSSWLTQAARATCAIMWRPDLTDQSPVTPLELSQVTFLRLMETLPSIGALAAGRNTAEQFAAKAVIASFVDHVALLIPPPSSD